MAARRRIAPAGLSALLVLVVLIAGCGDNGSSDSTVTTVSETSGAPSQDPQGDHVVLSENGFSPEKIYAETAPGVVTIESIFGEGNILGGASAGQGSGFVISDSGEIVTNAHVVTEGGSGSGNPTNKPPTPAKEVFVLFADGNKVPAEIVGFDAFADVALIRVDPEGLDLQPVTLGSSADVQVGAPVAAIGSPFGQERSISVGIVSATDRSIDSLTSFKIDGAIQTDASINPGNSGGPLLDIDGRVIGIDQQIQTESGGNEGVGFAVPIDLVKRSVDQLRSDGEVSYAYLGVSSAPVYPQLADRLKLDVDHGALVVKVVADSPASAADVVAGDADETIQFQAAEYTVGGDVIVGFDGEEIDTPTDLARLVALQAPGDKVEVEVIRDGEHQTLDVTLAERPVGSG